MASIKPNRKAIRARNLVDSALPQNSLAQNWGCTVSAFAGRIGSGYIGPAIMGDDIARRMYFQATGIDPGNDEPVHTDINYIQVPVIESYTELRNNSKDIAHVEVSYWKMRKGRNAMREVAGWQQTLGGPPQYLEVAPLTNNPLEWLRWELQMRQDNSLGQTGNILPVSAVLNHFDFQGQYTGANGLANAAIPQPPRILATDFGSTLDQKTVPIMDQLGTKMTAPFFNKMFQCVKKTQKSMGIGQVWPLRYRSKSSFNTNHILQGPLPNQSIGGVWYVSPNRNRSMPGQVYMVARVWGVPVMATNASNEPEEPQLQFTQTTANSTTSACILSCVTTQKYWYQETKYHNQEVKHQHLSMIPFGYRNQNDPNNNNPVEKLGRTPFNLGTIPDLEVQEVVQNDVLAQHVFTTQPFIDPASFPARTDANIIQGYAGDSWSTYAGG